MPKENPHLLTFKAEHLLSDEEVVAWAPAIREERGFEGAAILTNQRVVFFRKGWTSTKFEPWPLDKITSVETNRGMIFYKATLHTSGDELTLSMAEKERAGRFIDALQECVATKPARTKVEAPTAAATVGEDPIERIAKLAKLKEAGAISEEEFEAKKAQLLGEI